MLLALVLAVAAQQQSAWLLRGSTGFDYAVVSARGSALDRSGATLTLRSDTAPTSKFGTIMMRVPADAYRGRVVRIVADIDARNVSGGASAWLRVDIGERQVRLKNGQPAALSGTSSGRRSDTLYVDPTATHLALGLIMTGAGEATARGLRIEVITAGPPAEPARRILDTAFALVRAHALWRDTVTWSVVEPRVRAMAAGASTPADVYPAIRELLGSLGDRHSHLRSPMASSALLAMKNPPPEVRALPDSIGYVSVIQYGGGDPAGVRAYVTAAYERIAATVPATSCRWVVDLRNNGGGNMWPMIAALRPFLGDGELGSFVRGDRASPGWRARTAMDIAMSPTIAALEASNVAVLTGPRTASSGEATTIAFIGRPRTRSFGLPTIGLSTANATYILPDSSMLALTEMVMADRNGTRYGAAVRPDELVEPGVGNDAQLERAVAWLRSQPGCAR